MINNKKVLLLAGLLLLFAVIFVGGVMPYFIFYVFLLTLLFPVFHNLVVLGGLKGTVQMPRGSLYIGDQVNIGYRLENRSIFYVPFVEVQSAISKRLTGKIDPPEITTMESKSDFVRGQAVTLKRRGYYELGDIEITLRDVFRLFSFKKRIASEGALLVYPEVINLSSFEITASQQLGELRVNDPAFEDRSRVASLRGYQEGDSMKRVHWSMTAKKGDVIVKNYENRGDTHVALMVDNEMHHFLRDVDRRLEDKVVDAALCMTNYCLTHNINMTLDTQRGGTPLHITGHQKGDLKPFLEAFALFQGDGRQAFKTFLRSRITTIPKGATVIVVTPNLNKEMGAQAIQLKMNNLNPLFMVITDQKHNTGFVDPQVEKKLKQENISMYHIDSKANIKEILEAQNV